MLIKNEFEVAQPVDKVWQFFDNIPQVAACLPGAELTDDLGDDTQKNPNELEKCRALVNDYVVALDRRRRAHELGRLRQSASEVSARESEPGEAAAAAQAVIAHRRQGQG